MNKSTKALNGMDLYSSVAAMVNVASHAGSTLSFLVWPSEQERRVHSGIATEKKGF